MTTSPTPTERPERRVCLLVLDDQHRLLLCGGCCGSRTVPQVQLREAESFEAAASRFLAERFQVPDPRFGAVYGIRRSRSGDDWEFDRATEARVLFARVSNRQSAAIELSSATHVRWGLEELKARRREISPQGVVLLVTGYVEGWIPDGPISLY
ncbi:hypothetical protein ACIBI4_13905 [Streptomyces sp. NPDC050418]|uniref:hypothetical protein n=1 Tax=Streptomyces sp. NPDC050418 TaxID=3365612 RepID=UPI0037B4E939